MTTARIPVGSREYLLDRAEKLMQAIDVCADMFSEWGARRVIPSTLTAVDDVADPDRAITFSEPETGRPLALRQDLTNQVRRIVDAELRHLPTPFKLFYIERVWRSRSKGSRAKEQIQAGVEWIGPGEHAEAELLQLTASLVRALTQQPATLIVSHADLLPAWLDNLKPAEPESAVQALAQRNLTAWQTCGDPAYPDLPLRMVEADADLEPLPTNVRDVVETLRAGLPPLPDDIDVVIDPIADARGSYYNGMFFSVASGIEHDPWLRGGRYDGRFRNPADAIGLTLDLDPLLEADSAGQLTLPQQRPYLWTGPEAPPQDGRRWIICEASINNPTGWAAAHGFAGIGSLVDGDVSIVDPVTGQSVE